MDWFILFFFISFTCSVKDIVENIDLARKFGISESLLISRTTTSWKVDCPIQNSDFFNQYRDLEEIESYIHSLANKYSTFSKLKSIGESFQKRTIWALEIGNVENSPVILIFAGLHGREWTSIAALLYSINELLKKSSDFLLPLSIIYIPILNPDGYVKTFDGKTHVKKKYSKGQIVTEDNIPNRYWRKNANNVDLNRNFGTLWGNDTKTKSLRLLDSDVYIGSRPFSEKETISLLNLSLKIRDSLVAVVDVHCCMGAILGPPQGNVKNEEVGKILVNALSLGGKGVTRSVKNGDGLPGAYEWHPRAISDIGAGLSCSWAYHELAVDLTYVIELRGKFVSPCFEIKQLGKEMWYMLQTLIKEAKLIKPQLWKDRRRLKLTSSIQGKGIKKSLYSIYLQSSILLLFSLVIVWSLYLRVLNVIRRRM